MEYFLYDPILEKRKQLAAGNSYVIGRRDLGLMIRDSQADIVSTLEPDFVSRQHCEIDLTSDVPYVKDCNSRNGTYLNGARVTEPTQLNNGDRLTLGNWDVQFLFESGDASPVDTKTKILRRTTELRGR